MKAKDTYEVRRREGRPNHGQASGFGLVLASVGWLLQFAAVATPRWRTQWMGMLGYPRPRHWGLFAIQGKVTKMHHVIVEDTCAYWGGLNVGGACFSPICLWYRVKCEVYWELAIVSYVSAFLFALALFGHGLCIYWLFKLTPKTIGFASTLWPIVVVVHVVGLILYAMKSEDVFGELEVHAFYPTPDFGPSFIFSVVSLMCTCPNIILGWMLSSWWPDPDKLESSSEEEDEDQDGEEDSSDEGDGEFLKAGSRKGKKQADQAPQRFYDPSMGGGYAPPQGYGGPMPGQQQPFGGPPPQGLEGAPQGYGTQLAGQPPFGGPPQHGFNAGPQGYGEQPPGQPHFGGASPPQGFDGGMQGAPPPGQQG